MEWKKLVYTASHGWKGIVIPKNAPPAVYDENLKILRKVKYTIGSGCYNNAMFECSKCGKQYCTLGALRRYHKKCIIDKKSLE